MKESQRSFEEISKVIRESIGKNPEEQIEDLHKVSKRADSLMGSPDKLGLLKDLENMRVLDYESGHKEVRYVPRPGNVNMITAPLTRFEQGMWYVLMTNGSRTIDVLTYKINLAKVADYIKI